MRQLTAESRIQLEIWRTVAEIAAMDPDVTVRLAQGRSGDQGVLLRRIGDPSTKISLTSRRGIRLIRDSTAISWSWSQVLAADPLSTSTAVIDAALWAQGSLPLSTSAAAAGAIALAEVLTITSRWGANMKVFNRYSPTRDSAHPYVHPLPDFSTLRAAVREEALATVNFGNHVVLDRWWFVTYFGGSLAAVDVVIGALHESGGVHRLPTGAGVDARKAIQRIVVGLIDREC